MNKPTASHSGWKLGSIFLDTCFTRNLVLAQAVGICPIIMAGTDLRFGVVLTVCTLAVLLPVSLLMSLIGNRIPHWAQPVAYTLTASLLLVGTAAILNAFISTSLYAHLYLFIPLMAVNTIFTYRVGGFSVGNRPGAAVVDALGSSLGFGLVICLISAFRELLKSNTLWGVSVPLQVQLPEAAQSFSAFILLGLLAALLQAVTRKPHKADEPAAWSVPDTTEEVSDDE